LTLLASFVVVIVVVVVVVVVVAPPSANGDPMRSFSPRLATAAATSCVALFAATGCVSQKNFAQVSGERDRIAAELSTVRDDRARLTSELAETWAQRDAAWEDSEDIGRALQAALDRSQVLVRRSISAESGLEQTQAALATAKTELSVTRRSLTEIERAGATAREQLTGAQKRGEQLAVQVQEGQAALAQLRAQAHAQAEESAARLKDARAELAEAEKDQVALTMVRDKLAEAQRSDADARQRLAESEQHEAQLAGKLQSAVEDVSKLKEAARVRDVQSVAAKIAEAHVAAAASRKIQAELETARAKQVEAERANQDARARLAGAEKRVAELEVKVRTLSAQAKRPAGDGGEKAASDSTASAGPSN
jgi:chromosome segregation ATPase